MQIVADRLLEKVDTGGSGREILYLSLPSQNHATPNWNGKWKDWIGSLQNCSPGM